MNAIASQAPLHLWKEMCALVHEFLGLFGEPQEIAARHLIGRDDHGLICKWLRGAECFLRQLLLIEAASLPSLSRHTAPLRRADGRRPTVPAQADEPRERGDLTAPPKRSIDHPETWRVSFRVFVRGRRVSPSSLRGGSAHAANVFCSAIPLARRAEALLRAYNDPIPYARRLARRLCKAPQRRAEIISACADPRHGVVAPETLSDLHAHASAPPTRRDSS